MLTSYYSKTKAGTPGAISISRSMPRWCNGKYPTYKALAPGTWYRSAEVDDYIPLYMEILQALDPQQVHDDLYRIAQENARSLGLPESEVAKVRPILLCFEKPSDFCHRRLAANWQESELQIEVPEGFRNPDGTYTTVPGWEQLQGQQFEGAIGNDVADQMAQAATQLSLLTL
ncbi:MAG: hypothetical protein DCF32_10650 [Leptolyngbya sp.]|nr:MAG: hypothetical protein DCF32_10650 [Leptolyngbya sp.]